jgi:hypothetical protein
MIITAKPYRDMSLEELRGEYMRFSELHSRTTATDARESVSDVKAIIATWISRREREAAEAKEGVAA